MGRVYTAGFSGISVTGIVDILEIGAPSTGSIEILRVVVGTSGDAGDAEAEMLRVDLTSYQTTGTGGATVTPAPHNIDYGAFDGTAERLNTTQGGTPVVIIPDTFNVQAGYLWLPTPNETITIAASDFFGVELPAAPDDALLFSAYVTFEQR